jgi:hypothetical protein
MLERMSPRTMSASVSAFGPLDPSPGYGPAVSSGITAHTPVLESVAVVVSDAAGRLPQANAPRAPKAAAAAPAPAAMESSRRRLTNVGRS